MTQQHLSTTSDALGGVCLLALPFLDAAEFPLHLPPPSAIECGGYMTYSQYQYSPIDLLVAGYEAIRLNLRIASLTNFFDLHPIRLSEHEIYLIYKINSDVYSNNIARIKTQNHTLLLKLLHKHAPLTFKGVF